MNTNDTTTTTITDGQPVTDGQPITDTPPTATAVKSPGTRALSPARFGAFSGDLLAMRSLTRVRRFVLAALAFAALEDPATRAARLIKRDRLIKETRDRRGAACVEAREFLRTSHVGRVLYRSYYRTAKAQRLRTGAAPTRAGCAVLAANAVRSGFAIG